MKDEFEISTFALSSTYVAPPSTIAATFSSNKHNFILPIDCENIPNAPPPEATFLTKCIATYGGGGVAVRPHSSLINADSNSKLLAFGNSGEFIGSSSTLSYNVVERELGQKIVTSNVIVSKEPDNGRGECHHLIQQHYSSL